MNNESAQLAGKYLSAKMCGRTACTLAPDDICNACSYNSKLKPLKRKQRPVWRDPPGGQKYYQSYNVAPGSYTPVLISSQHYQGELDSIAERVVQPMLWGLVPSWHKGDPNNVGYETNNCRSEGMLEKKTYKIPLEKGRRCVVLADGFYEWKREKDKKQPYFIYFPQDTWIKKEKNETSKLGEDDPDIKVELKEENLSDQNCNLKSDVYEKEETPGDRRLLTMAGVFDVWKESTESDPVYSYSVITVESSPAMSWIHHRMPAILTNDDEIDEWLNFGEVPLRKAVQNIRAIDMLQMHPVSTAVGNSRYKSPDCVQPIDLKKPKAPVNSIMKNWLSKPKKEPSSENSNSSISRSPLKSVSPSKETSSNKQSKSSNLMMNWLSKGKREPEDDIKMTVKKIKSE